MLKPIVMFDMDGTLLDLAFDDLIWNHKLADRHAETHQCSLAQSQATLTEFYQQHKHTISWYSSSYWTAKVGVDVLQLQYDFKEKIRPRIGCFELLQQLQTQGYRCWLLTNADQAGLKLKLEQVQLATYFEVIISSEQFGYSKEHPQFWQKLQALHPFDPEHAVFVDDTAPVLDAAAQFGIGHLFSIVQPSSDRAARDHRQLDYPALQDLTELLDYLVNINTKVRHEQSA